MLQNTDSNFIKYIWFSDEFSLSWDIHGPCVSSKSYVDHKCTRYSPLRCRKRRGEVKYLLRQCRRGSTRDLDEKITFSILISSRSNLKNLIFVSKKQRLKKLTKSPITIDSVYINSDWLWSYGLGITSLGFKIPSDNSKVLGL